MKRVFSILAVIILAAVTLGHNAFAANSNAYNQETRFNGAERPEKPENEVIGKITAISANSITITLAEMKKPEGTTEPPKFDENNKSLDDMFTLSNETKTYNISSANFIKRKNFGKLDKADKDNNKQENFERKSREEIEKENKATYADFAVGDYVTIELESNTSTNAKVVKSFDRFFCGPRGGFDKEKGFNKENKNN